jgi:hypothetical protein
MNFCNTYHACMVSYPRESSDASDSRRTRLSGDGGRIVELRRMRWWALHRKGPIVLYERKRRERQCLPLIKRQSTARSARVQDKNRSVHSIYQHDLRRSVSAHMHILGLIPCSTLTWAFQHSSYRWQTSTVPLSF